MKKRLAWFPLEDSSQDRHHIICYKCCHCRSLTRACQYYGHFNDEICSFERELTVMDKPVCSREGCTNTEFLTPSHSLHQRFMNKDLKDFLAFFTKPSEADDFFRDFPAKECLKNNNAWCNFSMLASKVSL